MSNKQNLSLKQGRQKIKGQLKGKAEGTAKGDHRGSVHLGKMALKIVRWGGWTSRAVAKGGNQGDQQDWVHLNKMVLVVVRQGGWTAWAVAEENQWKPIKAKGDHQAQGHLGKMVLVMVRLRGWTGWAADQQWWISRYIWTADLPPSCFARIHRKQSIFCHHQSQNDWKPYFDLLYVEVWLRVCNPAMTTYFLSLLHHMEVLGENQTPFFALWEEFWWSDLTIRNDDDYLVPYSKT